MAEEVLAPPGSPRPGAAARSPRSRTLRFAALLLVAYAWLFAWFPALRSPNELSRLFEARALVRDRALAIDRELARHGPVGDLAVRGGRHYAAKAPGISFLAAPAYAAVASLRGHDGVPERAAMFFARLAACVLPGVLGAVAMRALLRRWFDDRLATAGATVFALGTLMWPYATQLASHATTASLLVASWYGLERARASAAWRWPALAGAAAGAAVVVEYTSALAVVPLVFYAILTSQDLRRTALAGAAAALPPLAALGAFHALALGHPLATPYAYMANPVYVAWHSRGFMGLGSPDLQVFALSFADPARGLFVYAPFLALGVPGIAALWRRDRAAAMLCGAAAASYGAFTAGFSLPAWGWSIGPRHLTPLCAFLLPPALALAADLRARGAGFVPAALAGYAMAVLALVCAVCPYFPDTFTNPLGQLVVPFARAGLHVGDVVGLATGAHAWWTLFPWALAVLTLALRACSTLASEVAPAPAPRLAALVAAAALAVVVLRAGGPDRFEPVRRRMRATYEPAGASAPTLFAPDAPSTSPGSAGPRAETSACAPTERCAGVAAP